MPAILYPLPKIVKKFKTMEYSGGTGIKNSGMGKEGGRFSIEEMTELKWITIQIGKRQYPI